MRTRLLVAAHFVALILLSFDSAYAQITPSQDAFTNSASPSTNYGANVLLDLNGNKETSYIQFDLSSIPSGANVSQATLKVYVNAVNKAGSFNVNYVNGTWAESTITHNAAPALGAAVVSNISLATTDKNQYILMDITPALQAWLNGSQSNDGIALVANGTFHASFDSKENTTTSHPPELDVVFSGGGTITGVLTGSSSGLTGGGTSGTLNLSLTTACAAKQILQWSGTAWTCSNAGTGTITGVTAGTDLTGGGTSGNVTLSLDTTKVPQLNAVNVFTGNMTVNGTVTAEEGLSVAGQVSAGGFYTNGAYYVQGSPFAFGSSTLGNAFLGFAGNPSATGGGNTGVGLDALSILISGTGNVAVGPLALGKDTYGSSNTALGAYALPAATTNNNNTATGYEALFFNANPNGNYNTANGAYSLYSNVGGQQNTGSGYASLYANTTGEGNTGFGIEAVKNNQTGDDNTALGAYALDNGDTGSNGNTGAGAYALDGSSGSNLTCIGYDCGAGAGALVNATAIGAHSFVNQSNALVLGGTGQYAVNVGIGTSTPSNILTIARGAGHPVSDSWETYSSRRWKTNIQTLPDALDKVTRLRGVSYNLKDGGKHEIGVIAEEVGAVVPEVVSYEANGKDASGVDYSRLTALLIEAVKQQRHEIAALQAQLRKRAAKQAFLESRLDQLKADRKKLNQVAAARELP
jgi:Chaperone of endosialidase/TGF-beta propeptide